MFEYTPYFLPIIISTLILFLLGIYSFRLRDKVEIAGLFALQNLVGGNEIFWFNYGSSIMVRLLSVLHQP